MRKPGDNPEPVSHEPSGFSRYIGDPAMEPRQERRADPSRNKYSHEVWQRYAAPAWFDVNPSDTLQRTSARDDNDSKHIAPLQLTVIRRAIELWTNPGDIVFSAFGGIGSEAYVALQEGRRAVIAELKDTYYRQAVRNCDAAIESRTHGMLFAEGGVD
jgi:DNA modification methylase